MPALLLLASCDITSKPVTFFDAESIPERLSDWQLLIVDGDNLHLNDRVVPYDLNTPLFSDYALKLRTVWMPPETNARYSSDREFDFPVGTIISKSFHYVYADDVRGEPIRLTKVDRETDLTEDSSLDLNDHYLAETRLLIRYEDGWNAYAYVWNAEQNEAFLEPAGDLLDLMLVPDSGEDESIVYVVPDKNQCAACHTPDHASRELRPLGPKARQLNRDYSYITGAENQLTYWSTNGLLSGFEGLPHAPAIANWSNPGDATLEERARAYLDVNCAHCHNQKGAADTSALNLNIEADVDRRFGICKPPVAVGRGSGDRPYDIYPGRAEESILLYRMEDADPAIAMPEVGRATNHIEAIELIRDWINSLTGIC